MDGVALRAVGGEDGDFLSTRDGRLRRVVGTVPVDRLWGGGLVGPQRKAGHMEEGSGLLSLTTGLEFGLWVAPPMRLQTQLQGCTEGSNETFLCDFHLRVPRRSHSRGAGWAVRIH